FARFLVSRLVFSGQSPFDPAQHVIVIGSERLQPQFLEPVEAPENAAANVPTDTPPRRNGTDAVNPPSLEDGGRVSEIQPVHAARCSRERPQKQSDRVVSDRRRHRSEIPAETRLFPREAELYLPYSFWLGASSRAHFSVGIALARRTEWYFS